MANKFVADPTALRQKGNDIIGKAGEFRSNTNKIYSTVQEMINSNYLDPAASAIAHEIESYQEDLSKMAQVIEEYGNFCVSASGAVIKNQDYIISSIN